MKKSALTALAVSIAVGGLGLTTVASAQPRGDKMPSFEMFDTNGDGVITLAEIEAIGAEKFAKSDTNGDGFLDADELNGQMMMTRGEGRRGMGLGHGQEGAKWQKGGRGDTELMQAQRGERMDLAIKHMLERADTDGDGKLDADELKAQMMARGEGRRGMGRGHGQEGANWQKGGHGNAGMMQAQHGNAGMMQAQHGKRMGMAIENMLERADADGDGKLSMEEAHPAKAGQMFERFDTDGNGEISQEEWDAAVGKHGNLKN